MPKTREPLHVPLPGSLDPGFDVGSGPSTVISGSLRSFS